MTSSEIKSKENIENVKVTLLGNSGVGKTCLISRFTKNIFDPNSQSTTGANFSQRILEINNKNICLDIWDTAGQERYRSLGRHFYRDAYIVILCYDITVKESFEAIKDIWYPDLKKYGEKFHILALVGNKCDKLEEEEVDENEAREYANSLNADFFVVSSKTGDGVYKLFESLTQKFIGPEFSDKIKEINNEKGKENNNNVKITKEKEKEVKKKKKKAC